MDARGFFETILPAEGVYFLGIMRKGQSGVGHKSFTSLEAMAKAVEAYDRNPDLTVYHACAAYARPSVQGVDKNGEPKTKYRVESNWLAAKALWIDVDVGAEKAEAGKGYPTKNEAWAAVAGFCKAQGFPLPLVVNSGGGLHCYWPFTAALTPAQWKPLAEKFKAVLGHFMVRADPTRTADFASILRPPGSHNKKDPSNLRLIQVIREAAAQDATTLEGILDAIVEANGLDVGDGFTLSGFNPAAGESVNSDITGHLPQYDDSLRDANEIANACNQCGVMRDTQGDVSYEQWRGVIGVLTFCEDGQQMARDWSARRAETGHSQTDSDHKFVTWSSGPTTCAFFEKENKKGCEGCPFKGKITSPVQLGRVEQEPAPATTVEVIPEGETEPVLVEVPEEIKGFRWDGSRMVRDLRNKLGVLEAVPFAMHRFYLTHRIATADGKAMARCRVHLPKNQIREFDIPCGLISSTSGTELSRKIGDYELMPTNNRDAMPNLTAYLKDSLNHLMHTAQQMRTMTTYGWKDDGFLIGERLYRKDGHVVKVILGGSALAKTAAFPAPKGDAAEWAAGVDLIYNRPGMEPMQYALLSGFGSLLSVFGDDTYKGIPLALTSAKSGLGKTTVCRAALYAFGNANELMINGSDGMTVNARASLMSTYNNLPMLVDEITNIESDKLSALLYAAGGGRDKERGVAKNGEVALSDVHTWSMSVYLTANRSISATLASKQLNTKAEANRVFEIKLDSYHVPELEQLLVQQAMRKIERSVGSAGAQFIDYIVKNREQLEQRFLLLNQKLVEQQPVLARAEYRFFRQHAVCSLLSGEILVELGLLSMNMERLALWTTDHIAQMAEDISEANDTTTIDALNRMIAALSSRIITTLDYDSNKSLPVNVDRDPAGRYVTGRPNDRSSEPRAGKLYIAVKAIDQWCGENRIDRRLMINDAVAEGLAKPNPFKFAIGLGTQAAVGSMMCYEFDMNKLQGEMVSVGVKVQEEEP